MKFSFAIFYYYHRIYPPRTYVKTQNISYFKEVNGVAGVHSVNAAEKSKRENEIANITINTKLRPLNVLEPRLKHEHAQSILEKVVSVYTTIN